MPKFYWTVMARSAVDDGRRANWPTSTCPPDWIVVSADEFRFGYADADIDAVVDAPESRAAKVAALRAHATQVTVEPGGRACALSNNIALPISASEHYVLVAGDAGRARRARLGDRSAGRAEPGIARARAGYAAMQSAAARKGWRWTRIWIPTCSTGRTAWTASSGSSARWSGLLDSVPT